MCQFSQTFTVWNASNVRFQITETLVFSDVIKNRNFSSYGAARAHVSLSSQVLKISREVKAHFFHYSENKSIP